MKSIGAGHPDEGSRSELRREEWAEASWPLGARLGEGGDCEFALYSLNAERVLLELYDAELGTDALCDYWMEKGRDSIWRARVDGLKPGALYAFRAWGPNWTWNGAWERGASRAGFVRDVDDRGNRFNPNKLLADPYARELSHDRMNGRIAAMGDDARAYGSGGRDVDVAQVYSGTLAGGAPRDLREIDTGPIAPKSVIVDGSGHGDTGVKPRIPPENAIVYEAHVRGLTKHPSSSRLRAILRGMEGFEKVVDVPEALRGSYAGAALMAPYIASLGYSAIEFLPVHESGNDENPDTRPGGNFWGYMTTGFFAPDRRYAHDKRPGGPVREFKAMIKAFHDRGIEVYLDVVFNHSGEGGVWDGTRACAEITSFRGIDNSSYYALAPNDPSSYWDSTGCGNNLNSGSAPVRALILDSLRYWCDEMGVDGFRFDLAPVLGRDQATGFGFNPRSGLLADIAELSRERDIEVIAEAWDTASGGYQVGNFPNRWAEWNGRYRDTVRKFMKGSLDGPLSPAEALHGDWLHFADQGGPERSVNFVVAHDGFTLADLVSYNAKNNAQAWPFGPSDGGSDANDSWDSGWTPPGSGCPDYKAFRRQRFRNFVAFLFMSRGVPMTVYGDEFGRTQNGNNNPYNIDSAATWNNYDMINSDAPHRVATGCVGAEYHDNFGVDANPDGRNALFLFHRFMTRLRSSSRSLRQDDYDMPIRYARPDGSTGYNSREDLAFTARIDGSTVEDRDFLVLVNMGYREAHCVLPEPDRGTEWRRIVDTAFWAETHDNSWDFEEANTVKGDYRVKAGSIVILAEC